MRDCWSFEVLRSGEEWGSNPEPIKSLTRCQRLAIAAILMCGPWCKAAKMGTAHSWHPKGLKACITKIWFELYATEAVILSYIITRCLSAVMQKIPQIDPT